MQMTTWFLVPLAQQGVWMDMEGGAHSCTGFAAEQDCASQTPIRRSFNCTFYLQRDRYKTTSDDAACSMIPCMGL